MFENIKPDLLRNCHILYGKPSLLNLSLVILKSMGFQAVAIYRFGRWSNRLFAGRILIFIRYFFLTIHYCLSRMIVKMYGINIDPKAVIGKGLYIAHFSGIEIGPCEMGEFCSIHQHVKIGSTRIVAKDKCPQIGSYVWVGSHARITGNVIIGDNSTVLAGTHVIKDISPSNLVAKMPHGKIRGANIGAPRIWERAGKKWQI